MATLYVKKIWSYNPKKYKYITYEQANKLYNEYIDACIKSPFFDGNSISIKTFDVWLKTEI